MDSHRKTKMKDPNSEEGDTEKCYMNLCEWAEPKMSNSMRIIIFVGVSNTMTPSTGH